MVVVVVVVVRRGRSCRLQPVLEEVDVGPVGRARPELVAREDDLVERLLRKPVASVGPRLGVRELTVDELDTPVAPFRYPGVR